MSMSRRSISLLRRAALPGRAALPARAQAAQPLQVVASFSILADMAREVGGDAVAGHRLVGRTPMPTSSSRRPADAQRLAQADLVVVNGLGFEGWIDRLVEASGYRGRWSWPARHRAAPRRGRGVDPHAWQSLANARRYVENIRAALVAARPGAGRGDRRARRGLPRSASTPSTRARAQRFEADPARRSAASSPRTTPSAISAPAYGVDFLAPQGWNTDSEASAADVARVIRQIKAQKARALFVENISDPRLIERIAQETGVRGRRHAVLRCAVGARQRGGHLPRDVRAQRRRPSPRALAAPLPARRRPRRRSPDHWHTTTLAPARLGAGARRPCRRSARPTNTASAKLDIAVEGKTLTLAWTRRWTTCWASSARRAPTPKARRPTPPWPR